MNSQHWGNILPSGSWGNPLTISTGTWWMVLVEIYMTHPVWRQVPFTLEEDQKEAKDLNSEVSAALNVLLQRMKEGMAQQGLLDYLGPMLKSRGQNTAAQDPTLTLREVFTPFEQWLDPMVVGLLTDNLAPSLTTRILDGVKSSLAIQEEHVPLNLAPPDERGRRFRGQQQSIRRLQSPRHRGQTGPVEAEIAQTVVGRSIWDATLLPVLVPQEDIQYLLSRQEHLALQKVTVTAKDSGLFLEPVPWCRLDLARAKVHPKGAFPLGALQWPPTPRQLDAILAGTGMGSPMTESLLAFADALGANTPPGWWTLEDLLFPPKPENQTSG